VHEAGTMRGVVTSKMDPSFGKVVLIVREFAWCEPRVGPARVGVGIQPGTHRFARELMRKSSATAPPKRHVARGPPTDSPMHSFAEGG
jgi:hypothetical protein